MAPPIENRSITFASEILVLIHYILALFVSSQIVLKDFSKTTNDLLQSRFERFFLSSLTLSPQG